jgi:hypothetical protein
MSFTVAEASLQPIAQIEYRNLFLKVLPSLGFIYCLTFELTQVNEFNMCPLSMNQ